MIRTVASRYIVSGAIAGASLLYGLCSMQPTHTVEDTSVTLGVPTDAIQSDISMLEMLRDLHAFTTLGFTEKSYLVVVENIDRFIYIYQQLTYNMAMDRGSRDRIQAFTLFKASLDGLEKMSEQVRKYGYPKDSVQFYNLQKKIVDHLSSYWGYILRYTA